MRVFSSFVSENCCRPCSGERLFGWHLVFCLDLSLSSSLRGFEGLGCSFSWIVMRSCGSLWDSSSKCSLGFLWCFITHSSLVNIYHFYADLILWVASDTELFQVHNMASITSCLTRNFLLWKAFPKFSIGEKNLLMGQKVCICLGI